MSGQHGVGRADRDVETDRRARTRSGTPSYIQPSNVEPRIQTWRPAVSDTAGGRGDEEQQR
jgi:hypothetical protein